MKQLKDNIDFGKDNVRMLFNRLFYPTLLGMVFSMVLNVTDGIFVGRGIGSVALAAVFLVTYLFNRKHEVRFASFKVSTLRAWMHTLRNCGYMCKLGFSTMFAQFAVALMIIVGNNIFVRLGGDI